jgi:hypothetical protein
MSIAVSNKIVGALSDPFSTKFANLIFDRHTRLLTKSYFALCVVVDVDYIKGSSGTSRNIYVGSSMPGKFEGSTVFAANSCLHREHGSTDLVAPCEIKVDEEMPFV